MRHRRPEAAIGASIVVFEDFEHWRLFALGRHIAHGERWDRADALDLIEAFRGFVLGFNGTCMRRLYRDLLRTACDYYADIAAEANKTPQRLYADEMIECTEKTALWRAIQIERLWRILTGDHHIAMAELRRDLNVEHELAVIDVQDNYFGGKMAAENRRYLREEYLLSISTRVVDLPPTKPKPSLRQRKLIMAAESP